MDTCSLSLSVIPTGTPLRLHIRFDNITIFNQEVNDNTVPPLLIYTDLMNTGDHRCIETAQKIYNELFKEKF